MKNNKKSGVQSKYFTAYKFEDHIWNMTDKEDLLELAQRCVKVDSVYYLKQSGLGHWVSFKTMADAIKEAGNTWMGGKLKSGTLIDMDLINMFFEGMEERYIGKNKVKEFVGACPNIAHTMVIPMGPQYLVHDTKKYLNLWHDDMITANANKAVLGKLMLEMIYRSLCNGAELHYNKDEESTILLEQVVTNTYTNQDFKFCMNWLAAIYQRPGINLQTNLWFCGQQQGVGKGTLVDVMKQVLGSAYVGDLNQTEIEAGWNDHIMGKMLISSNEFDTDGKMSGKSWNKWIKKHTIDPTVDIRQRNMTARSVLNIGNYIFTSNEENPIYLDKTDRRNHLIKTTDDNYWKEFAAVIQTKYVQVDIENIAAGFAWVLEQVQIDTQFVNTSFINTLKASIISSSQNIVEEWLTSDPLITKNKWVNANDLYTEFKDWLRVSNPASVVISSKKFGEMMGNAETQGVQKKRSKTNIQYEIGVAVVANNVDRASVARDVGGITQESITVQDNDVAVVMPVAPVLTDMQRMRAKLQRLNAVQEQYGYDENDE